MIKSYIIGLVLTYIAGHLVGYWHKSTKTIVDIGTSLDDKLEAAIQKKFPNFHMPEFVHETWDTLIPWGVAWVEKFAGSKEFVRNALKYAMANNPESVKKDLAVKLESLKNIDWDGNFMAQLPPEWKEVFNQYKEEVAVRVVANKAAILPALKATPKPEEEVRREIRAAAKAEMVNAPTSPIRKPEVQEMIEVLRQKVAAESR